MAYSGDTFTRDKWQISKNKPKMAYSRELEREQARDYRDMEDGLV